MQKQFILRSETTGNIALHETFSNSILSLCGCLEQKQLHCSSLLYGNISGNHKGVLSLLKNTSPHSIFEHCHCHLLQLACVQAANSVRGIKYVYTILTSLCKLFHYSPKRTECLKEIEYVFNLL